jgi:hypothetical protein
MIRDTPCTDADLSIDALARVVSFDTSADAEAVRKARADLIQLNHELFRHMAFAFHDRNKERRRQRIDSIYRVGCLFGGLTSLLEEHPSYMPEPLPPSWEDEA